MSGKRSSDQVIENRRIRPIYDAIDSGQNKKAIQEADKVLKKHPDTLSAKALKALALIRTERSSDAWGIVSNVEEEIKAGNTDPNLLQTICYCYKESFVPERIVTLYEILSKQFPNDESFLSQLFLAHVRVHNYSEQQKVAMKLYKDFNLPPYFMWCIMSIVMQGLKNEKMGSTMFYPLAEKMLNKITESYSFKGEEVNLYLMVLEARGKVKESINYITNDLSCYGEVVAGTKAYHALERLNFLDKNFDAVSAQAIKKIEKDCNDWTSWFYFFDSQFEIINAIAAKESKQSESVIKKLIDVAEVCLHSMEKSLELPDISLRRGSILACLEMLNRLMKLEYLPNDELQNKLKLSSALNYIKDIVDSFRTKPYCFLDVKLYLHLLSDSSVKQLITHIDDLLNLENNTNFESTDLLWTNVLKEKIILIHTFQAKAKLTENERNNCIKRIFDKLPHNNPVGGKIASAFAGIIAGYLLEINTSLNYSNALKAILILENIWQEYTNCDMTIAILLCRLYALFGDVSRVQELCRQLDIKYIQRDSLGYLEFFLAERFGRFKSAILFYTSISSKCDQNERENGQFSQISKLSDFYKCCVNSVYSTASDICNQLLSACFAIDSIDVVALTLWGDNIKIDWDNLSDNRDFGLIASMTSNCCCDDILAIKSKSLEDTINVLRIQHFLCRSIGALAQNKNLLSNFSTEFTEFESNLKNCEGWCESIEQCKQYSNINYFLHLHLPNLICGGYAKIPLFVLKAAKILLEAENEKSCVFVEKLLSSNELFLILKAVIPAKEKKKENTVVQMIEFIEKCALSLNFLILSVIALKLITKFVVTKFENEKEISQILGSYYSQILNALRSIRAQLIDCLGNDADEILKNISKPITQASSSFNTLQFPEVELSAIGFKGLNDKTTVSHADTLLHNIQNSIKTSFTENIRQMLEALATANETLLDNALFS